MKVAWVRRELIGRGSYGTVSLAYEPKNEAVFAVKSVDKNSTHQLNSLENEIKILRSISSPHIITYLGDDTTGHYRNLHVEYMPGGTLADLAQSNLINEPMVRSYTRCIVSALSYLHSRGLVHCDVKGSNVLVGPISGSAKLADLGSAMITKEKLAPTVPIVSRGSPMWMAPEVVRGEHQGPESDVWSLGCTVVEIMNNGKLLWSSGAEDGKATLFRIGFSNDLPKFPSGLSDLGRDFLDKCLRRNVGERWSCDQLLEHPFLDLSTLDDYQLRDSPTLSPRCVLDSFALTTSGSGGAEEDDSVSLEVSTWGCWNCDSDHDHNRKLSAMGRINKLATSFGLGAAWESDGWVAVRSNAREKQEGEEMVKGASSELCFSSDTQDSTTQSHINFIQNNICFYNNVSSILSTSSYSISFRVFGWPWKGISKRRVRLEICKIWSWSAAGGLLVGWLSMGRQTTLGHFLMYFLFSLMLMLMLFKCLLILMKHNYFSSIWINKSYWLTFDIETPAVSTINIWIMYMKLAFNP